MYLVRKKKARIAHLWDGEDTICRMHSTGGLNKRHYKIVHLNELPICTMCQSKKKSGHTPVKHPPKFTQAAINAAIAESVVKQQNKIPTQLAVWLALTAAHQEVMIPFKTFSDPSGGRMETTYGIRGADFPLIHVRTTWDSFDGEGLPENEKYEYWLMIKE